MRLRVLQGNSMPYKKYIPVGNAPEKFPEPEEILASRQVDDMVHVLLHIGRKFSYRIIEEKKRKRRIKPV